MTDNDNGDHAIAVVVCGLAIATFVVYVGAFAAALVTHAAVIHAGAGDALRAVINLAQTPARPRDAWPPSARDKLPGPVLYWLFTSVVATPVVAGVVSCWVRFATVRVGTKRRRRLGVEVRGRLATVRELKSIIVTNATPGRFTLGRVHGRLVATENPDHPAPPPRRRPRHAGTSMARGGNRSAVAVIGPSQCGKTSNVVCSILEWDGPAVLSSVKSDLLALTAVRRNQLGEVWVFDPLNELDAKTLPKGWKRCGWSPLPA